MEGDDDDIDASMFCSIMLASEDAESKSGVSGCLLRPSILNGACFGHAICVSKRSSLFIHPSMPPAKTRRTPNITFATKIH